MAETATETEAKTYTGSCHCGGVRYQVTMKLGQVMSCNCSMCGRTGTLLAFAPLDQFVLLDGADLVADYQFGKKRLHHFFCPRCGIRSFAGGAGPDGKEMRAINVRCLEGVDVDALPVHKFDGKSV
ncbi:MAG TPA: GFA family protein [Kofleriaceae bacterium]|nr:GFA family protein [Kofleriaceae bacterium]